MTPPTVPMPDEAKNDGQAETMPESASTEAGKVSRIDDKGSKACATDDTPTSDDIRLHDGG